MRHAMALAAGLLVAAAPLGARGDGGSSSVFFAAFGDDLWPLACVKDGRLLPGRECLGEVRVGQEVTGRDQERGVVEAEETLPNCRQPRLRVTKALTSSYAFWPASTDRLVHGCRPLRGEATTCTGDLDGDGRPDRVRVIAGRRHDQVFVELGNRRGHRAKVRLALAEDEEGLDEHVTLEGLLDLDGDRRDELWITVRRTRTQGEGEGAITQSLLRWKDGGLEPVGTATCWGD
jgi:hypothetical protein